MSYRAGIDIGGTFTDLVLQDVESGELTIWKRLSTPADPSIGAVEGLHELLDQAGVGIRDLDRIVHGTTIGANIVVEKKGARTALITTDGFRDILVIQRQLRYSPYDIYFEKHVPLVPRDLVFGLRERLRFDGSVHRPLDEGQCRAIAIELRERGVESVAVALLHSYANGAHERRAGEILKEECGGISISLSSEVAPVIREYERTSTTVVNAYIRPAFQHYLTRLEETLRTAGFRGSLHLMQANGGIGSVETTTRFPVRAIESGPAAGVAMATELGPGLGAQDVLAFEMGGTTAKACLIENGEPHMLSTLEIDQTLMRPGTGLPLSIPSVDLIEIGAGGGSIARQGFGIVQVGPESAGATPGPAAYQLGGRQPTVTDANLVLGYLDPSFFLGGRMTLDEDAARSVIEEAVGNPLGIPVDEAAWGIHETVTLNMEHALRAVSIERGVDPRSLTLIAFGGAGPLHATRLGRNLEMPRVIIPFAAGVMSAVGLLKADPRFDLRRTYVSRLDALDNSALSAVFAELEVEIEALLSSAADGGNRVLARGVDMRYVGQGHVLDVALAEPAASLPSDLQQAFDERYAYRYGYSDHDSAAEITAVRVSGRVAAPRVSLPTFDGGEAQPVTPPAFRLAYFPECGGFVETAIHHRDELWPGAQIVGPAIVEDRESTVVLLDRDIATVDEHRNLVIQIEGSARDDD